MISTSSPSLWKIWFLTVFKWPEAWSFCLPERSALPFTAFLLCQALTCGRYMDTLTFALNPLFLVFAYTYVNITPSALIFPERTEEPRIPVSRNWILGESLARLQTRQTWWPFSTLAPGIFSKLARISEYTTSRRASVHSSMGSAPRHCSQSWSDLSSSGSKAGSEGSGVLLTGRHRQPTWFTRMLSGQAVAKRTRGISWLWASGWRGREGGLYL